MKLLLNTIKPKDGNKLLSLKLLYNSDIEGENEEKFKSCFIGKNDIIIFIETKEYKRFGGYAHEAFKDYEGFIQKDSNAFLFNLDKLKIYKYKSKGGGYTIWNNDGNSMDFGGGVDLRIFINFFRKKIIQVKHQMITNIQMKNIHLMEKNILILNFWNYIRLFLIKIKLKI